MNVNGSIHLSADDVTELRTSTNNAWVELGSLGVFVSDANQARALAKAFLRLSAHLRLRDAQRRSRDRDDLVAALRAQAETPEFVGALETLAGERGVVTVLPSIVIEEPPTPEHPWAVGSLVRSLVDERNLIGRVGTIVAHIDSEGDKYLVEFGPTASDVFGTRYRFKPSELSLEMLHVDEPSGQRPGPALDDRAFDVMREAPIRLTPDGRSYEPDVEWLSDYVQRCEDEGTEPFLFDGAQAEV